MNIFKIPSLLILLLLVIQTPIASAQGKNFKKYKSKTRFDQVEENLDQEDDQDEDDEDEDGPSVSDLKRRQPRKGPPKDTMGSKRGSKSPPPPRAAKSAPLTGPSSQNVTRSGRTASKVKQKDFFGRNKVNPNLKSKKKSKYVNLNPETAFGPEVITSFDFVNTDIMEVTKHMQKLTGINLILDKDVKGKITISAPSAITVGDAWKAYLAALNMNGYTLVKSGAFYKIIHTRDVRYTPTKIYTGAYTPNTEQYVMRVLPLKHIDASEIVRTFRPFMSRYGRLLDIKQTNTLIIADTGSNINRIIRLIDFLDVSGHEETLQIIKVKHSSAQEIAKLLDQIMKGGGKSRSRKGSKKTSSQKINIIAEPRTNSIIAMTNAEGAKRLKSLIDKLDVPGISQGTGKIHVYYLNHGDAETLAKTLSTLTGGSTGTRRGTSRRFTRRSSNNNLESMFTNPVKITADKENNAIVVTASPTDYLTIKSVIAKLDVPRDQVYIEGLIMETNVTKVKSFGTSIVGAYGSGATQRFGFDGTGKMVDLLAGNLTNLGGLFVGGGSGSKVEIPGPTGQNITVNTVNGLIRAIATHNNTNVLATPQLLVLDNTEGIFEVGETVPVQETTNAANGSSQTSVREQKVALTLKITPQINKVTRFIKLKINQKVDDFSGRELGGVQGVGTTTRSANTTVIVRDRDTLTMGGLMRDKETQQINKVPLLGDIPVLGWLFKSKNKTIEKVNLLFFLTPKILASYQATAASTTKSILNRRNTHLKESHGGKIPFGGTVKGLYKKIEKQEKGPLYDNQARLNQFYRENSSSVPDYKKIMKMASKEQ